MSLINISNSGLDIHSYALYWSL